MIRSEKLEKRQAEHGEDIAQRGSRTVIGCPAGIPWLRALCLEISAEPLYGKLSHSLQCARLLEKVPRTGHDHKFLRAMKTAHGFPVELDDLSVTAANDQ